MSETFNLDSNLVYVDVEKYDHISRLWLKIVLR